MGTLLWIRAAAWLRVACIGATVASLVACGGGGASTLSSSVNIATTGSPGSAGSGGGSPSGGPATGITLSLLAGIAVAGGSNDGPGNIAMFSGPDGPATDPLGNTYIADTGNNTIRKITPAGVVSTLAGTAGKSTASLLCWTLSATCGDGAGSAASFTGPTSVAYDRVSGNLYVADTGSYTIRQVTLAGTVTTFAGTAGVNNSTDGPYGGFNKPSYITADGSGTLWVVDTNSFTQIRKITPTPGAITPSTVTTVAGGGNTPYTFRLNNRIRSGYYSFIDGVGTAVAFSQVIGGMAFDWASGKLFIADVGNATIRALDPSTGAVTTYAGACPAPPPAGASPSPPAQPACSPITPIVDSGGLATDPAGNLYTSAGSIQMIAPTGVVAVLAGTPGVAGSTDGTGSAASFGPMVRLSFDSLSGNLYAADNGNNTIRKITLPGGVVTTLAGIVPAGSADGSGAAARFLGPQGLAVDAAGTLYVSDTGNNTIRTISPTGLVTTLAGTAGVVGSADDTGPVASFWNPMGLAIAGSGNLYVADEANATIRRVTPGGVVTTFAGTAGLAGADDGNGVAASFATPVGLASDSAGNLYVADPQNCNIRKITPAGDVSTVAGPSASSAAAGGASPGTCGSANGTGSAASFNAPQGVATDNAGNIYVADTGNHTIRKITPPGSVTTLAGTPGIQGNADGSGGTASFNAPNALATDSAGNVYVADTGNSLLRKVTPAGVVSTIPAVTGSASGFPVQLSSPLGLVVFGRTLYATSANGIVYIANLP